MNSNDFMSESQLIQAQRNLIMNLFSPVIDVIVDRVSERFSVAVNKVPRYNTRQETANILHVTLPTLHNMVKRGDITAKRVNGRVLFDAAEIDSAVKDCRIYKYKRK